jgi:tetratricopeptide (TPR) repeat protein
MTSPSVPSGVLPVCVQGAAGYWHGPHVTLVRPFRPYQRPYQPRKEMTLFDGNPDWTRAGDAPVTIIVKVLGDRTGDSPYSEAVVGASGLITLPHRASASAGGVRLMSDDAVLDRYLCMSVDVQGYGTRDDVAQIEVQAVLMQMLDTAGARAGVDRGRWRRQPKGDEELALIPADAMAQRVVGEFCFELAAVLHCYNLQVAGAQRLRLRIAFDEGPVQEAANGFVGRAVVTAGRLVNSQTARQALASEPDVNLVVVLSHGVYRDWVASGRGRLKGDQFRRVRVREKEVDEDAWLWVPGARCGRDSAVTNVVPADTGHRSVNHFHGTVIVEGGVVAPPRAEQTLPADVVDFVGRQDELQRLLAAVTGRVRAVAIHAVDGMAGVGKTALAVHAAHALAARFPDGRLFVDLCTHKPGQAKVDPTAALATLLQADGVAAAQIPASVDARAGLWRDRMANKRVLLVLDDAADTAHVAPLLPGAPGCLVLITSRRRLTTLPDAAFLPLDILPPEHAAELFLARAGARAGHDPASVERITRLCGYLPLAITLTAARLHTHPAWTVADLANDLDQARDRLAELASGDLAVAAAFDLSYRDLPASRQRLFRRLGLHPGPDLDAYAAAALDDTSLAEARRGLEELLEHNLVTEPHRGRFRLHDLIAAHVRTLAATDPPAEQNAACDRLCGFYLHAATAAAAFLARRTPPATATRATWVPVETPILANHQQAADWLTLEQPNLAAAAGWAATRHRASAAVAIPAARHDQLRTHGPWALAVDLHQAAPAGARGTNNHPGHALTLTNLAEPQRVTDDYPAAATTLWQALVLYRQLGDRQGQANVLHTLGIVQYVTGDYEAATTTLGQALDLSRQLGNRRGQADATVILGDLRYLTGDYAAAATTAGQALSLYQQLGNRRGQADALHTLGVVYRATGDFAAAATTTGQALSLYRQVGNRRGQATALRTLGLVQQQTGDFAAAATTARQARDLYQQLGDRLGQASALDVLGRVQYQTSDYVAATTTASQALDLYRQLGCRHGQANALQILGVVQYHIGDYAAAAAALGQALDLFREVEDPDGEAETLNHLGELLLTCSTPAAARHQFTAALAIAHNIGTPLHEARALGGIGHCALREGHRDQGITHLQNALAIHQRVNSPHATLIQATLRQHNSNTDSDGGKKPAT